MVRATSFAEKWEKRAKSHKGVCDLISSLANYRPNDSDINVTVSDGRTYQIGSNDLRASLVNFGNGTTVDSADPMYCCFKTRDVRLNGESNKLLQRIKQSGNLISTPEPSVEAQVAEPDATSDYRVRVGPSALLIAKRKGITLGDDYTVEDDSTRIYSLEHRVPAALFGYRLSMNSIPCSADTN